MTKVEKQLAKWRAERIGELIAEQHYAPDERKVRAKLIAVREYIKITRGYV